MKTLQTKKDKIKSLVEDMLNESHEAMMKKIEKLLISDLIDIDNWDEFHNPMILPKCIVTAILKNESTHYKAKGTSFEKQLKKEVANLMNLV